MTAAMLTLTEASDERGVLRWRFDRLLQAGYARDDAAELACRLDVDLHFAVDLPGRGCPTSTALRILL